MHANMDRKRNSCHVLGALTSPGERWLFGGERTRTLCFPLCYTIHTFSLFSSHVTPFVSPPSRFRTLLLTTIYLVPPRLYNKHMQPRKLFPWPCLDSLLLANANPTSFNASLHHLYIILSLIPWLSPIHMNELSIIFILFGWLTRWWNKLQGWRQIVKAILPRCSRLRCGWATLQN